MKSNRPLIRMTFRQERFDILIKKQRNGKATFNDLTELDDIVNRDPDIRESILEEMQADSKPPAPHQPNESILNSPAKPSTMLEQIKAFINRLLYTSKSGFSLGYKG
ncbi:hypothetical protein DYU05_03470 [Mucilaginibacter terrenus]|uniref:Uncharacterized protein n=1 Tax=Mucilaginibacter terrenus TaxID=2482727 RepID=A0A3E2NUR8_9SPHI|nr:hypothetical protein [Mucilaginibacter terrenus]RFZ84681.1 hypothetical protein DYU05_03470 [Mucilaginibacter terrenus]